MICRMRSALLVMLSIGLPLGGCVVRSRPAPDRTIRAAGLELTFEWPATSATPAELAIHEGQEYADLVDHGLRGEGRLYEVVWHEGTIGPDHSVSIEATSDLWLTLRAGGELTEHFRALLFTSDRASEHRGYEFEPEPEPVMAGLVVPEERFRGTAIVMTSLEGTTPGEAKLMERLLADGWTIVWVSPLLPRFEAPIPRSASSSIETLAATLARRINRGVAQRAFAVEATMDLLDEIAPDSKSGPTIAVGSSAGAITVPAVAARLDGHVDAAVLIGGGADVYDIVTHSSLFSAAPELVIQGRPASPEEEVRLAQQVLTRSSLDPYHTAPAMGSTPVLLVDAMFDAIVPRRNADLLYERLGEPERWSYPVGHVGLFVLLPTQVDAIMDWIEATIGEPG